MAALRGAPSALRFSKAFAMNITKDTAVTINYKITDKLGKLLDKAFDLQFLESMATNPEWATQFSVHELVEKTGTQGVELLMWLAMRGALSAAAPGVRRVHGNYHIPISNTATALLALEAV